MKTLLAAVMGLFSLVAVYAHSEGSVEWTMEDVNLEKLEALRKGDLDGILCLEKGSKIPFMVSIEGDVVSLGAQASPVFHFEAASKIYIKFQKGNALFSTDKETWRPFDREFKGMVEVKYGEGDLGTVKLSFKNFKKKASEKVLELDEGATVPLVLSVKGDLLSFPGTAPKIQVQVQKKLFIKVLKKEYLFSRDQESWTTPEEFFRGMIGFAVGHEEVGLLGEGVIK